MIFSSLRLMCLERTLHSGEDRPSLPLAGQGTSEPASPAHGPLAPSSAKFLTFSLLPVWFPNHPSPRRAKEKRKAHACVLLTAGRSQNCDTAQGFHSVASIVKTCTLLRRKHRCRGQTCAHRRGEEGVDWETGTDVCTLLTLCMK